MRSEKEDPSELSSINSVPSSLLPIIRKSLTSKECHNLRPELDYQARFGMVGFFWLNPSVACNFSPGT